MQNEWQTLALILGMFLVVALVVTGGDLLDALAVTGIAAIFFGVIGFLAMIANRR